MADELDKELLDLFEGVKTKSTKHKEEFVVMFSKDLNAVILGKKEKEGSKE